MNVWPAVPSITDSTPVCAATVMPSLLALAQRTTALKDQLTLFAGDGALQALVLRDVAVSVDASVGMAVYFNVTTDAWAPAKADAVAATGIEALPTSYALGVVVTKSGVTGNVLIAGQYGLAASQLVLEDGEIFREGAYYVSARKAGAFTAHKPDVAVFAGVYLTDKALACFQTRDMAEAHLHTAFPLYAAAAGNFTSVWNGSATATPRLVGYFPDGLSEGEAALQIQSLVFTGSFSGDSSTQYILTHTYNAGANQTVLSWLSDDPEEGSGDLVIAGELEFNTLYDIGTKGVQVYLLPHYDAEHIPAPTHNLAASCTWTKTLPDAGRGWVPTRFDAETAAADAAFEYNIGYHDSLNQVYPPVPLRAASLLVNGLEQSQSELWPDDAAYTLTTRTLYWRSDNSETLPWSEGEFIKQLTFHMVRMAAGNTTSVSSIRPKAGSPLQFYKLGTKDIGTSGDLEAALDLTLASSAAATTAGHLVVKEVEGSVLKRGPVVEKIQVGEGLELVPMAGSPAGQGTVRIQRSDVSLAGSFDLVALENAKEEKLGMFPYLKLLKASTGIPSAFTANFQVPYNLSQGTYKALVYATIFGTATTTSQKYAGLNFTYNVLPDFQQVNGEVISPETANLQTIAANAVTQKFNIPIGVAAGYTAYDPVLMHNDSTIVANSTLIAAQVLGDAFPAAGVLRPGYTVAIKFANTAVDTGYADVEYAGELGFLNLRWKLVKVA